ncbi:MAG TPA: rubredoxin [Candidatus Korarchaeota archaeon]|nr:MAG: rubredoxin [Candidatus Korarchaeota archaeon]HDI74201.1 rubredoxin [Candidatus Korarchaeota archaeon]
MAKWRCLVCNYVYDEDEGDPNSDIPPGTLFDSLPDDWVCPVCGAPKDQFEFLE